MDLSKVKSTVRVHRISEHSHILGLGLRGDETSNIHPNGFEGQHDARKAAQIVVDMIRSRKLSGRGILISGPLGTGKTALAVAFAKELHDNTPFCSMVGYEVYSSEIKKVEVLCENFRRAVGLRIKDISLHYKGKVTEIKLVLPSTPAGLGALSHVFVTLETLNETKKLKFDVTVYENMLKEGVKVGDIVEIKLGNGEVKRMGSALPRATSSCLQDNSDILNEVPMPKGDILSKRHATHNVTVFDLDTAYAKSESDQDILLPLLGRLKISKKININERVRKGINKICNEYTSKETTEIIFGVLFIDEVHMLDMECFAFLNKILDSPIAPILVLASNRGYCNVRGVDDIISPHGIPSSLMKRLLIIKTDKFTQENIKRIIQLRAVKDKTLLPINKKALKRLAELGVRTTLRYVIQLLTPASIIAKIKGNSMITKDDIDEVKELFIDVQSSSNMLPQNINPRVNINKINELLHEL